MTIEKQPNGNLVLDLNADELYLFGQTLNECCGGFGIENYMATLGAEESVVRSLLDQIVAKYS